MVIGWKIERLITKSVNSGRDWNKELPRSILAGGLYEVGQGYLKTPRALASHLCFVPLQTVDRGCRMPGSRC